MTITLTYYPKELIPFLNLKKSKSRIFPEIEVSGEIFESVCDLLSEFMLFYSIKKDTKGNEIYEMNMPLNPVRYYAENHDFFDATKYHWYIQWTYITTEEIYKQRLQIIQFLESLKVINVNYNPPQDHKLKEYFIITMNFYPQAEAFSALHNQFHSIRSMVEDTMDEQQYEKGILPTPIDTQLRKAMNIKYWVDFYMDGRIVMNGKHLISQPHLGTENDNFFDYIVRLPKQKVSKNTIEQKTGKLKNSLSKIIYDLGFTGELKKLFFPRVSNNFVFFNNQIREEDLFELGIDQNSLNKQLKLLKTI